MSVRIRTLNEAAELLGTTRHRLRRGIDAGRYPSLRWQNRLLVDVDAVGPIVAAEDREAEALVGIGEMSRRTGLPATTLRRMCKEGLLPYQQDRQRRYRFRPSDVMAALQDMMR